MVKQGSSDPADRVLRAADRLFYEQGYTATGVNQIIAEAEVARASFYQHFPSKKDLAVAYLRHRHRDWFQRLHEHIDTHTDPVARVLALFDFLEVWLPATQYRGCAFLNMASESPALGEAVESVIKGHKSELRRYIGELAAGACASSRDAIGDGIHVLFEGAIIESQVMRNPWPLRAAREAARRLVGA